jgi:hypothetical protein
MGFNSAFKGLKAELETHNDTQKHKDILVIS